MAKSKIFLILSLSFIVGIFIRSFWNMTLLAEYLLVILAIILLSLFYKNKIVLISGCAVLFFVFGIWLMENRLAELNHLDLNGKSYSGEALIIKEPATGGNYQKIVAKLDNDKEAQINTNLYPEYFYGDRVKLSCNLEIPENIEGFNYRMYLAKDRIYYICKSAKLELVGHDQGDKFYAGLLKLKNKFNENINRLIPFPQAGLLSGLILGGSGGFSKELQNNFSRTGMTHIVAVSGYNVTIVAEYLMLMGIFLGLWRKQAFYFAIFGILIFILMTGMTASAVRAGMMGGLLLWALKNGRLANSQNAILFAASIMILFNPLLLRYDIGFQLSFLATLGIVYLYPVFESKLNKEGKAFWLWEILLLSLSAQIFVLPIILYNFQTLSLISLLANVLVLPIIPLTMLLGFLMAVFAFIFAPLATIFAWLAFLPLKYETMVISFLGNLKFSAIQINSFPWWGMAGWYIILIFSSFLLSKKAAQENAQ